MEKWENSIEPQSHFFEFNFKEIWRSKDLLYMFVKRDVVTFYKQTVLGPLWFLIQPILTVIMFAFVFGTLAGISTDGLPQILFYMAGIICWNYFADCLTRTSATFITNATIFGKVYFPRLIVPLSVTISNMIKFAIQFALFMVIYFYYYFKGVTIQLNMAIFLFPLLLIMMAGLGLGFGILFSSMTTKYRDLTFLLQFGVQLWMYTTPVIYPLSSMPEKYHWLIALNPMTSIIETFKYGFLGNGIFNWFYLGYSFLFMILLLLFGVMVFNKVEKSFMDTV